jgi:hypothetical protein
MLSQNQIYEGRALLAERNHPDLAGEHACFAFIGHGCAESGCEDARTQKIGMGS